MNNDILNAEVAEEHADLRFDKVLALLFPDYSRSKLQSWIRSGRATLDGTQVQPRVHVAVGQLIALRPEATVVVEDAAEAMPLSVVYEDEDVLIINKPVGLVVHPGAGNHTGTLMNGLLHHAPVLEELPRAGILHRLDKDTSGLLLVAKTQAAHTHLVRDLEEREIKREYRAICMDRLTAGGTVTAAIGRHRTQRTKMAVSHSGKPAVSHYRVLARFRNHSFIAVRLETGRTHQIRVHMAHVEHPLIGDGVYGGRLRIPRGASDELREALTGFKRQALHAGVLGFRHPAKDEWVEFHAPLPDDLLTMLNVLAKDADFVGQGCPQNFDAMQWPS